MHVAVGRALSRGCVCVFVCVCLFATLPRFHVRALCDALLPCACEVVRFHGTMYSVAGTDGV